MRRVLLRVTHQTFRSAALSCAQERDQTIPRRQCLGRKKKKRVAALMPIDSNATLSHFNDEDAPPDETECGEAACAAKHATAAAAASAGDDGETAVARARPRRQRRRRGAARRRRHLHGVRDRVGAGARSGARAHARVARAPTFVCAPRARASRARARFESSPARHVSARCTPAHARDRRCVVLLKSGCAGYCRMLRTIRSI